jgi:pimeloyl-ACP methyl ester carboxylesterase
MPFAQTADGTAVYYETHGAGPAVVLVHGSGGHHAAWWQQVPALSRRYTVVTLDLRGFGRTGEGQDAVDLSDGLDSGLFPGDILAVLHDAGIGRAVLAGQSIGAVAGRRAALAEPERVAGVVLAHSLGGISDPELSPLVAADRAEAVKLPVLDRLLTAAFRAADPAKAFLFRQMGTFNRARMQDLRNLDTDGPTVAEVTASGIPICFLAGADDAVLSAKTVTRAAELVQGSHLELIPDTPHAMYWENPELFNAALERFLQLVYPQTAPTAGTVTV